MTGVPVSILLPTFNSASTVKRTLESVRWADSILVVDSFSTDTTLEICREYGADIVQHEYINSAKQKNWAAPRGKHDWVFQIDTDEVMSDELIEDVQNAVATAPPEVHAFRMPRKNHVLGRWMRFGGVYPDYQIRLFRRDLGRWDEREVHAHLTVPGEVADLRSPILHYGMPHLSKQLSNIDRYTRYEADELRKHGKKFRLARLLIGPWAVFVNRYFRQQGFRDGFRGFVVCAYHGIYDFLSHTKLWELEEMNFERSPW